jgi:hypothetical protein
MAKYVNFLINRYLLWEFSAFIDFPWQGFVEAGNYGLFGLWIINVFCSQFRSFLDSTWIQIISSSMKSIGSFAKYPAIWIIAISTYDFNRYQASISLCC